MQAYICDSCKSLITDSRKRYTIQIDNVKFHNNYYYKDLCDECYNKLKNTFFKDQED